MPDEAFLLVSLKEDKSKKLAQVISNDTSRKILDYLSTKQKATETEIAKTLKIPISTAHYNLAHLMQNKLVQADEFHYSDKGKEVLHYSLSNKLIIIAPKGSERMMEKLRSFLPVALIMVAAAAVINFIQSRTLIAGEVVRDSSAGAQKLMAAVPEAANISFAEPIRAAQPIVSQQPLWFLVGALSALVIYFVWEILWNRKNK
jgi:predicted ArsR family transcriptional regulator